MTRITTDYCDTVSHMSDKYLHATRRVPSTGTMLGNSKYRFREDRKKVLKISVRKLREIDDPEAFLCRSVLINNTMKRLQQELRDERKTYTSCKTYSPSPYSYFSVERTYREEMERMHATQEVGVEVEVEVDHPFHEDSCLPSSLDLGLDSEDTLSTTSTSSTESSSSSSSASSSSDDEDDASAPKRRRAGLDDVDDLLSEVYMQPTLDPPPAMIGNIDEEMYALDHKPDLEAKEELAWPERPSTPIPWNSGTGNSSSMCPQKSCDIWCCHMWATGRSSSPGGSPTNLSTTVSSLTSAFSNCHPTQLGQAWPSSNHQSYNLAISSDKILTPTSTTTTTTTETSAQSVAIQHCSQTLASSSPMYLQDQKSEKHYTCGQTSLLGELQSLVFNSRLASLET